MTTRQNKSDVVAQPTIAAPLASAEFNMPASFEPSEASAEMKTETEKRMLLFRLSEAGMRIREEADLIRRTGFTNPASRLLRILGETVEEQHVALGEK